MNTYIGKIQIGSDEASLGSTLYGICATAVNAETKIVILNDFDSVMHGITIFVKFNSGNSVTSNVRLSIGNSSYNVVGNCVCSAGEILSFTFDETDNGVLTTDSTKWHWIINGHIIESATNAPQAIGTVAVGTSMKYAKEDHVHSISLAEGDANGQVKIAGTNINVHGLGDAAYTNANEYATSAQGIKADNAMPKSGGTFTGSVILNGAPIENLEAATKAYVDSQISSALTGTADAMVFKGTIGSSMASPAPTVVAVPTNSYSIGDTYRVVTAGTYAGETCEIGDLLIAIRNGPATGSTVINDDWTIAQGNLDGVVIGPTNSTAQHVARFKDTTGKEIEDSGYTIGTSVPSDAVFTDTTYTITNGTAYTAHTISDDNESSILASVSQGVLTLAPGIKFTTGTVTATLNHTTSGPGNSGN